MIKIKFHLLRFFNNIMSFLFQNVKYKNNNQKNNEMLGYELLGIEYNEINKLIKTFKNLIALI